MGVPKFFRYTSERYPCLNELVKQYQIPDFDNMYLDMNGIIHNCSHPDDSNPHFRITEEKIFQDIFHYLSILFQIIKPKKLFFMAIDGVAPRAKMNQQRGRRFRSAREAEKLEADAREKGEVLPTEKRFDSNCITPGTVFMARLHAQLRFFVKQKMSSDPLWSNVKVILSGHETPGEGEHKIMDYIRWSRSQPDYDPNTRHCLYGLDADLIMLGMCTHEPHFALLREEVKFGKTTQRATSPEETNFYLLHLSLLREYLAQEFIGIKDNLPFEYDIEKVVDDWVLMGFLVGNDFIPNLPNMHISNDALPVLYRTYMTVLPTLDGYINEAGDLNLARFEIFMQELAKIDLENFQDTLADFKFLEDKTGSRRPTARERRDLNYKPNDDETFNVNVEEIKNASSADDELANLINRTKNMFRPGKDETSDNRMGDGNRNDDGNKMDDTDEKDFNPWDSDEEPSDEELTIEEEFTLHKKDYYKNKLAYTTITDEVLADQAEGYVRAIQWNLYYYYKGCPSWCWFYPHHYAPFISDIKGFKDLKIEFELGEPFKPFEQLLAVLPAASKQLLPTPFHYLMTHDQSPIVHYYPVAFETDLNGKRNDWEAVVLIPFIDEVNLLSAMEPCYQRLTEEEKKRNKHGPMLVYNWTSQDQGTVCAPEYFTPIAECHAIEKFVWREELEVPESMLKRGMLPNAKRDMLFPGFPTMRHLKYQTSIKKGKVKVFDQQSRNENMIVEIIREEKQFVLEDVAKEVLGKVIWVGWPHLTKAKVISVSNEKKRLHYVDNSPNNYTTETNAGNLHKQWIGERSTIIEHNMNRLGIELGDVKIILHAVNLKGYKYIIQDDVRMVEEPEWCSVQCGYAHQAVVQDVSAHIVQEGGKFSTPQEAYPVGDRVVLLTNGEHYGAVGNVTDSENIKSGRIKVAFMNRPEPIVRAQMVPNTYKNANHAAALCGISTQLLSRVTGTILVSPGKRPEQPNENANKLNIGLNLKFNKKNLEVSGYTRRGKMIQVWTYSDRCVELVKSYARKYPDVFDRLAQAVGKDVYYESDLFPEEMGKNKAQEINEWLKSQPHTSAPRRECGSECLEPEEMLALARGIEAQRERLEADERRLTLQVKWSLLYKPELHSGNLQPDPNADFKLYDRVVSVAKNMTVPMGSSGTITAIYLPSNANTVRLSDKLNAEPTYQVMFDKTFPGAMSEDLFDEPRFYRMSSSMLVNLSYGRKLRSALMDPPDPYAMPSNNTPLTILRPNDGHHSAFANYSSPGEKMFLQESRSESSSTARAKTPPQDNASYLLRSLLKISESETPTKKPDTKTKPSTPEQNSNWRKKTDASPTSQPVHSQRSATVAPPTNWRNESAAAPPGPPPTSNNRQPPLFNQEWMNNTYKNQPLVPPYPPPVYGQPFQGPGPNQIPFPQFSKPHFQPRNNQPSNQPFAYGVRPPDHAGFNQAPPPQRFSDQGFPKHLPSVATNVTLGPSWHQPSNQTRLQNAMPPPQTGMPPPQTGMPPPQTGIPPPQTGMPPPQGMNMAYQQQNAPPSNPSLDRANNPFVPLQVQTRRTQPSGSSSRRDAGQNQAQRSALARPQPINPPVQQPQNPAPRPVRRRKPRIAANLPFETENPQ